MIPQFSNRDIRIHINNVSIDILNIRIYSGDLFLRYIYVIPIREE
nr:MAG TPA: hypothetical protein [Caudoviricetes sp.]